MAETIRLDSFIKLQHSGLSSILSSTSKESEITIQSQDGLSSTIRILIKLVSNLF